MTEASLGISFTLSRRFIERLQEADEINVGAEGMRAKGFISLHGSASKVRRALNFDEISYLSNSR